MDADLTELAEQLKDQVRKSLTRRYGLPDDLPASERSRLDCMFNADLGECGSEEQVRDVICDGLKSYKGEAEEMAKSIAAWRAEHPDGVIGPVRQKKARGQSPRRRRADSASNEERRYRALAVVYDQVVRLLSTLNGRPKRPNPTHWTALDPIWSAAYPEDAATVRTPEGLAQLVIRAEKDGLADRYVEERRSLWLRRMPASVNVWAQIAPIASRMTVRNPPADDPDRKVTDVLADLAAEIRAMAPVAPNPSDKKAMLGVAKHLERYAGPKRPAKRRRA
jgi:hypothetical protein